MLTYAVRLLPAVLVTAAAMAYVAAVEGDGGYLWRNLLPAFAWLLLCACTLYRGNGRWRGAGWRWLLGCIGFAVPALGLTLYLHYGYANDLDGMYSEAIYPQELFRFLPVYTLVAGGIGFAIGWIAGRNV